VVLTPSGGTSDRRQSYGVNDLLRIDARAPRPVRLEARARDEDWDVRVA
jgi:hypothetical protein